LRTELFLYNIEPVAWFWERDNELSGSLKKEEFLVQLIYYLVKKYAVESLNSSGKILSRPLLLI
jgi:hypothetical protein